MRHPQIANHFPTGAILVAAVFGVCVISLHRVPEHKLEERPAAVRVLGSVSRCGVAAKLRTGLSNPQLPPDLPRSRSLLHGCENTGLIREAQGVELVAEHQLARLVDSIQAGQVVPTIFRSPG